MQVKMGFGLHVGWAIEGAIGSRFKIDASYLSPHVNMASRLEAATKQFGTSILVSEDFAKLLTPGLRRRVRPTAWHAHGAAITSRGLCPAYGWRL